VSILNAGWVISMSRRKTFALAVAYAASCSFGVFGCRTPELVVAERADPAAAAVQPAERLLPKPNWSDAPLPTTSTTPTYLRLTAEECRRAARNHSGTANLLDGLAAHPGPTEASCFRSRKACDAADTLRRSIAHDLSEDIRSRTAAAALDLYYRLQEAELLQDVLTASLVEVNGLIADGETAVKAGAREPAELATAKVTRSELLGKATEAQVGIARLSTELKGLVGLDAVPGRILPSDAVNVVPEPLDAASVAGAAVQNRADLRAIRTLAGGLTDDTAAAVQSALSAVSPLAGAALPPLPKLSGLALLCTTPDFSALREAVNSAAKDKEREVIRETTTALDELLARQDALAFTRQATTAAAKSQDDIAIKVKNGVLGAADLRKAKLDKLQADADEIRAVYAWKLAEIKLRRAVGAL